MIMKYLHIDLGRPQGSQTGRYMYVSRRTWVTEDHSVLSLTYGAHHIWVNGSVNWAKSES